MLHVELQLSDLDTCHFKLAHMSVGDSKIFRFRASPHELERTSGVAANAGGEHYMISTQITGTMAIRSGADEIVLRPGDVGILDTSYPFFAKFTGNTTRAIILINKRRFPSLLPLRNGAAMDALPARHPYCRIVRQYILSCADTDHRHERATADALIGNLALAVSYVYAGIQLETESMHFVTIYDANSYIREHHSDPNLTPTSIAAGLGISLRKLFSLYEKASLGVEKTIIQARLSAALEIISSPEFTRESITSIAIRSGFKDSAHFSRKFREACGVSPSEWRAART
jgi:AraC-like DNA-binding protein